MAAKESQGSTRAGSWRQVRGPEPYRCFIPAPLPPEPPIIYDTALQDLAERANRELGRLDGLAHFIPSRDLFLYMYVRKEAVVSSQIEGSQSSLSQLLLFENEELPGVPLRDVKEVSNYVSAIEHGLRRIRGGFPLSLRLMKEIHQKLLRGTRGGEMDPGEFRRTQNWVGGTRPGTAKYVPPPPEEVLPTLGKLEKFIHGDPAPCPTLLLAGLVHAQFETIHPFLDGNGRVGRLLITLILCERAALTHPLLYLSLYFKEHRQEYYDGLQAVRTGDWEHWLKFYFGGVEWTARDASRTAQTLIGMFETHRQKILTLGKGAPSALRLHDLLKERGVVSLPAAQKELELTFPTVAKAMAGLERMGIVREVTKRSRERLFSYEPYVKIIGQGTEPLQTG